MKTDPSRRERRNLDRDSFGSKTDKSLFATLRTVNPFLERYRVFSRILSLISGCNKLLDLIFATSKSRFDIESVLIYYYT